MRYGLHTVADLRTRLNNLYPFRILSAHTETEHFYEREDTGKVVASVTSRLSFVDKPYLKKWYAKKAIEHIKDNLPRLLAGDEGVLAEASGAAERSRDFSAGVGTSAHDAVDRWLSRWIESDTRPDYSAVICLEELCKEHGVEPKGEEIAACRSFDKFIEETEIIPIASEIRIWYEEGKDAFAGTVDAIFLYLKTRKGREGRKDCAHDYETQASGVWWCAACGREVDVELILNDWKSSNTIRGKDDYALQSTAYRKAIEKASGIKFSGVWVIRLSKEKAEYEICAVTDGKQAWLEWIAISRAFDARSTREVKSLLEPLEGKKVISLYD